MIDEQTGQLKYSEELQSHWSDVGLRLRARFDEIARNRQEQELEWLKDLRQFKGVYDPDVASGLGKSPLKKSKTFIRMTRTKVKAMDSRIMQMLFPANSDKNWDIQPTPKADPFMSPVVAELMQQAIQQKIQQMAQAQGIDPATIDPAAIDPRQMALSEDERQAIFDEAAKQACTAMRQEIEDQLAEIKYRSICKNIIHQGNLYGTGVMKAPLVQQKEKPVWMADEAGNWGVARQDVMLPFVEAVSVWDFYPDDTATDIDDAEIIFQYHAMRRGRLMELCNAPGFRADVIKQYAQEYMQGDATPRSFEAELKESSNDGNQKRNTNTFGVLECWVPLSAEEMVDVRLCGCEGNEEAAPEAAWCNIWLLGPFVIKAEIKPLAEINHPYHVYYFDKDETSIWGGGLGQILRDDQIGLNSVTRAMLDNAAASVGAIYDINVDALLPNEFNKEPLPGTKFLRTGNQRAIEQIQIDSRITEFMALRRMFEQNMHENSLPAYMHADQNVGGAGNTASGLSMLMGAANISISDQVVNWDAVTMSVIRAIYYWNMTFNNKANIKGDFTVVARGSTSLVAKEVRGQQLNGILVASNNSSDQAIIKRRALWEETVKAMDLDGAHIVRTEEEYDELRDMQQQLQQSQQQVQQMQGLLQEAAKVAPTVMRDVAAQLQETQQA